MFADMFISISLFQLSLYIVWFYYDLTERNMIEV